MQRAGHLHNLGIVEASNFPNHFQEQAVKNLSKMQSKLVKFMVAASFLAMGATAIGGEAPVHESVGYPVGYSDLDMSKVEGARILYLRIRHAAETLCESAATWGKKEGDACVRKATDDAVARVNSPLLSQYYQLRIKGDKEALVQLAKTN